VSDLAAVPVSQSRASVVRLMVPTDANFAGTVFGGQILSEIDRVAYIAACRHARTPCVTASFDRVDFLEPVRVGDVADFTAEITYVGRTSMEVWVRVTAEGLSSAPRRSVGEAYVTMVAVDAGGRPTPVPALALETEEERQRWADGEARTEARRRSRHAR
jgi:acyl-CoA hydrolase